MTTTTKHNVKVALIGQNGNAFAIIGKVRKALCKAGVSDEEIKQYCDEAMAGDYNNLLCVTMQWVEVE